MRKSEAAPVLSSPRKAATNFPIVPIEEVVASGLSMDTDALRPIVLVVDREPPVADALTEILNRSGYAAVAAYDGEAALETALLMPPDMLITGIGLPGISGIELAIVVRETLPDCKVLLVAGEAAANDLPELANRAAKDFDRIDKPIRAEELLTKVSASLHSGRPDLAVSAS